MKPRLVPASSKPSREARLRRVVLLAGASLLAAALLLAAAPPLSAAPPPLIGANLDPSLLSAATRDAELARLADSGISSVRFVLDWNRVEPQPNRFTWDSYDALVDAARNHGLEVVLVLGPCAEWAVDPAWQVPPDRRSRSLPKSIALWERYVRRAVSHFRGRVRFWQVRTHPNSRNFRGARSEYLRLLAAAAQQARAANPEARIIVPEPGNLGIATFDRLLRSPASKSFDILGAYLSPPDSDFSGTALAWAALTHEVLGSPDLARRPPVWILGAEPETPQDKLIAHYLLAWVFGADRCYLASKAIDPAWLQPLTQLDYCGFIRLGPDIWALHFAGVQGPVLAAWSTSEIEVPASHLAPIADPEAVRQAALLGSAPGSALARQQESRGPDQPILLRLGPRPALIPGLAPDDHSHPGPPTRRDVLAARPGLDLQHLPLVYADCSMQVFPEFGLHNRSLRTLPGGNIQDELHTGRHCLRAHMTSRKGEEALDNPYLYFDVDDSWLFFARGQVPVAITIECERAFRGKKKLGFNIMYDSTTGYRFTPWQWVEPGSGWSSYRFVLDDVSFANRSGYDFRINAKGSKQDLWVAAVTVEKLPPRSADAAPRQTSR